MASAVRLTFESSSLDAGTFSVAEVKGEEHISRLFRFVVTVGSPEPDLTFTDLVNKPALLTMTAGAETVRVQGLVADFEQREFRADFAVYRAVLVPRVWLLTLNFQSRIFQEVTVEDVIKQVLKDGGLPATAARFDLKATYPVREYCVQYQETDWDFICRLMERDGIFFYFEEGEDGEVMVIRDRSSDCPPAELSGDVIFHPGTATLTDAQQQPTIHEVRFSERVGAGIAMLQDYNYRTPDVNLFTVSDLEEGSTAPGFSYEYGVNFKDASDGNRLARVRFEAMACARTRLSGGSTIPAFRPGHTFELALGGGNRSDLDGTYLLTRVVHAASQESGLSRTEGLEGGRYSNTFEAIPARLPFRPERRTPVPRVPGLLTAVTESKGGDHPHLDEEGRYRVRLHFDLRDETTAAKAEASHPIRMKQALSGPNFGWHSPNHEGTEMVLAFVNGDPDRPMALGTAPNPTHKSPVTSVNKAQSVFRSRAQNELTLDDTTGAEQIFMLAVKDRLSAVSNDEIIDVEHDRIVGVGHDETLQVNGNRTATVKGGDTTSVGGSEMVTVYQHATLLVDGDRTVAAGESYYGLGTQGMYLAGLNEGVLITGVGDKGIVLDGTGSMGVSIGGKPNFYATGAEKAGLYSKQVSLLADDKVILDAPLVDVGTDVIKIHGNEIKIEAGGSSITIKPSGIEITSSGPVTVKGVEIKLNS